MTEAEEILEYLAEEIREYLAESYWPEHEYNAMWRERKAELRAEALAALSVLIEGCIGEDETEYSNLDGDAGYWEKHGRNQLRKEIRDNLREKRLLL